MERVEPAEAARIAYEIGDVAHAEYIVKIAATYDDYKNRPENLVFGDRQDTWTKIQFLTAIYLAGYINGARSQKEKQRAKKGGNHGKE